MQYGIAIVGGRGDGLGVRDDETRRFRPDQNPNGHMTHILLRSIVLVAAGVDALRLPPSGGENFIRIPNARPIQALPPATNRDVAAEMQIAASLRRSSRMPISSQPQQQQRELFMLTTVDGDVYQQVNCHALSLLPARSPN